MFFIIGLIMGAAAGFGAVVAVGSPLVFARGLGLLWGDRRLWWTLALVVGAFLGHFLMAGTNGFKIQTDHLAKGFVGCQRVGVYVGAITCWGIGMLILWRWGSSWRLPLTGISWGISSAVLLVAVASCVTLHSRPGKIRAERAANRAEWVTALQTRDFARLKESASAGHAIWSHLKEIKGTPFQFAIREGDVALFEQLLVLHPKSRATGFGIAGLLVSSGSRTMLDQYLEFFELEPAVVSACLIAATCEGKREVFDYLLEECQADANATSNNRSALMMAVTKGRSEMAEDLIRRGADVNAVVGVATPYIGETALQVAVHFKQEAMVELLLANGAQVDLCHRGSLTPLMRAIKDNNLDLAPLLLQAGASRSARDKKGNTALHFACQGHKSNMRMVELLLAAGFDPSIKNAHGFAPVDRFPEMNS